MKMWWWRRQLQKLTFPRLLSGRRVAARFTIDEFLNKKQRSRNPMFEAVTAYLAACAPNKWGHPPEYLMTGIYNHKYETAAARGGAADNQTPTARVVLVLTTRETLIDSFESVDVRWTLTTSLPRSDRPVWAEEVTFPRVLAVVIVPKAGGIDIGDAAFLNRYLNHIVRKSKALRRDDEELEKKKSGSNWVEMVQGIWVCTLVFGPVVAFIAFHFS